MLQLKASLPIERLRSEPKSGTAPAIVIIDPSRAMAVITPPERVINSFNLIVKHPFKIDFRLF